MSLREKKKYYRLSCICKSKRESVLLAFHKGKRKMLPFPPFSFFACQHNISGFAPAHVELNCQSTVNNLIFVETYFREFHDLNDIAKDRSHECFFYGTRYLAMGPICENLCQPNLTENHTPSNSRNIELANMESFALYINMNNMGIRVRASLLLRSVWKPDVDG